MYKCAKRRKLTSLEYDLSDLSGSGTMNMQQQSNVDIQYVFSACTGLLWETKKKCNVLFIKVKMVLGQPDTTAI